MASSSFHLYSVFDVYVQKQDGSTAIMKVQGKDPDAAMHVMSVSNNVMPDERIVRCVEIERVNADT